MNTVVRWKWYYLLSKQNIVKWRKKLFVDSIIIVCFWKNRSDMEHIIILCFLWWLKVGFYKWTRNFTKFSSRKSVLVCILFVLHGLASSWNGSSTCYILLFWILFWFLLDCNTVALHFKTRNSIFPWEITSKESCFRYRILDPLAKEKILSLDYD